MSEGYKAARPAKPETPIEGAKEKLSTDEQWKKLRAVVVETTRLVEAQARDVAEDRMTESKEDRSKGWMERTATRIWKHNLFQEYYRQREIVKARGRIIESENLYIDETDAAESQHKEAVNALFDRFTSEYEEDVLRKDERESKKTIEGDDANARIEALIREYAGNREMGKEAFDEERGRIIASLDPANRTSATTYADNFFELATQARDAVEHGAKLSELDLEVSLTLGKARGALDTEAKMTTFDRAVEKLKGMPLGIGSLVTNESVVTLAAIAYAGTKGLGLGALKSNASKVATFGAGLGIATVLAGYNEAIRLRRERSQHMRERAKGKKFDSDAERRNEMEENIYDTVSARDLSASLEAQLEKARAGTLTPEEMAGTLQSLADLEARIALGEENQSDLISYSRFDQVEQERTQLVTSRGAMKTALRAQDPENFDTKLKELVQSRREALVGGEAGMEAKDQIYEKMRNRKVAKVAIRTAIVGTGFGLVAQEVGAAFDGQKDGLLEGAWKSITGNREDLTKGATALEGLKRFIPGAGPRMSPGEMHTVMVGATSVELPEGADLVENPDGTYDLTREGDVVSNNLALEFGPNGDLTDESRQLLAGDDVGATFALTEGETVSAAAYVNEHEELTQHVRRGLWYDNDTPKPTFDKNELKQWWGGENGTGIDANGNFVFSIDQMSSEGSYHGDMSVDAQERMRSGELKMLLSLSRDTQHHVFEVAIDANGNAIIPKDSEIARLMFEEVDGRAVFVGQYAEVAQDMGAAEDGAEQVRILSTVVGEGRSTIDIPPVAHVALDVPDSSGVEMPPFLPLPWARRPLERGKNPPPAEVPPFIGSPGYYGYAGFATPEGVWAEMERSQVKLDSYYEKFDGANRLWVDAEGKEVRRDAERERARMRSYLEAQDPTYLSELNGFAAEIGPMDEKCRVAVIIPARFEEKNLGNLLDQYSQQVDADGKPLDPALFEINVIVNRKEGETLDDSMGVIQRWKESHPGYRVNAIDITFQPDKANVGTARKYITDLVLSRAVNRVEVTGPLYIESEDADLVAVDRRTVSRLISSFDEKPHLDVLRGMQDRQPEIMQKNDLFFFEQRMNDMAEVFMRREAYRPENVKGSNFVWNRVISGGWNTAFSAEAYAQIGGYVPDVIGEDMKIGQKISLMRGHRGEDGELVPNTKTAQASGLRSNSSPRRFLDALSRQRGPYDDFEDQSLKHKTLDEMLDSIKEYAVATEAQKEIYESNINRTMGFLKEQLPESMAREVFGRVLWGMGLRSDKDYTYRPDGQVTLTKEAMPHIIQMLKRYKEEKRYLWGYKRQNNSLSPEPKPRVRRLAGGALSPSRNKKPVYRVKAGSAPSPAAE